MNEQKPRPSQKWDGFYRVHSMFLTVQGEGPFSGDAAVFVRLEGCNIQCPFCDTEYEGGLRAAKMTAREVVEKVNVMREGSAAKLVVITGGEPFRQDITELVASLMGANVQNSFWS